MAEQTTSSIVIVRPPSSASIPRPTRGTRVVALSPVRIHAGHGSSKQRGRRPVETERNGHPRGADGR